MISHLRHPLHALPRPFSLLLLPPPLPRGDHHRPLPMPLGIIAPTAEDVTSPRSAQPGGPGEPSSTSRSSAPYPISERHHHAPRGCPSPLWQPRGVRR